MRIFSDRFYLLSLFSLIAFSIALNSVSAITLPNDGLGATLSISAKPEYPRPMESVVLSLSSPSFDVNTAEISWVVNGVVSAKGVGIKTFSFTTGKSGSRSRIDVVIKPVGGDTLSRTFDIYPSSVDIVWQANTYTPPFYAGKAEHTTEGTITFAAVPNLALNGQIIPKENLVYQWNHNGRPLSNSSGYGKDTVTIINSFTRSKENVSVIVTSVDKSVSSKGEVVIPVKEPKVIFYEDHPLYGLLYNRAVSGEINLSGREMTFSVSPFFFPVNDPANPRLVYNWLVNGASGQTGNSRQNLTFRNESGDAGSTAVSLKITDPIRVLSFAESGFLINFGEIQN